MTLTVSKNHFIDEGLRLAARHPAVMLLALTILTSIVATNYNRILHLLKKRVTVLDLENLPNGFRKETVNFGNLPNPTRGYERDISTHYRTYSTEHFATIQAKRAEALVKGAPQRKIVIVGGGPAGLTAAYEAYTHGHQVVLLEARESYARDQIIRLGGVYGYIEKVLGNTFQTHFVHTELVQLRIQGPANRNIFSEGQFATIELRDLENCFSTMLKVLAERDPDGIAFYSQRKFTKILAPSFIDTHWRVVAKNGKQEEVFPADIVVGADGNKSFLHSLELFTREKRSTEKTYGIISFPFPKEQLSPIFAELAIDVPQLVYDGHDLSTRPDKGDQLARMRVNRMRTNINEALEALDGRLDTEEKSTELDFVERGAAQHLNYLQQEFGWEGEQLPVSRFFSSYDTVYCGFEIPENFFSQPNGQEHLQAWGLAILKAHLPTRIIEMLTPQHGSAFKLALQKTSRAHAQLTSKNKNLHLFSLGDSYATPHFLTGSGAQNAIFMAQKFGTLLDDFEHANFEQFEEEMAQAANELHDKAFRSCLLQPAEGQRVLWKIFHFHSS